MRTFFKNTILPQCPRPVGPALNDMKPGLFAGLLVLFAASCTSFTASRAASFSSVTNFAFAAGDVVYDSARDELYLSQTQSNRVLRINPVNGVIADSFVFDFKPEVLAISPDGSNLVVHFPTDFNGSQAYVQTVNLATGEEADLFPVNAESISDLICLDNDLIVCALKYGTVRSFRLGFPDMLSNWGFGNHGHLVSNSSTDFYGVGYEVVRHFSIDPATGQLGAISSRDSYAGYKPFLHPSRTNLITSSGAIFSATSDPTEDLVYLRSLPFQVEAAMYDLTENAFFAATATDVVYCNATTYHPIRTFPVTNTPVCLALSGDLLVCVTVEGSGTRLFTIPNPAAGAATNTPPDPTFSSIPVSPDTLSPALLDASASVDAQDPTSELTFRWDWNNDGEFDTDRLASPEVSHRFSVPGDHRIVLEVEDSRGASASVTNTLQVVLGADAGVPGRTNAPFNLPFVASDVVLGLSGTNAYLADPVGKCLVELNLTTGRITREFPCSLAPTTLALTPDRRFLYAGLAPVWPRSYQEQYAFGLIDEIDMSTGLRTRELEITADPFDLIATADSLIVSRYRRSSENSGSAWWRDTALQRTNFYIGYGLKMALHPSGTALYATPTDTVPYDFFRMNFDTNGILSSYDSRYHGDHPVEKNVWVEPEGKFVLTQGGGIYTSASERDGDMLYVQTLENGRAEDCFFDASRNAVFTISDSKVSYYNSTGFVLSKDYPIADGGRFVLANSNSLIAFSVTVDATVVQAIVNPAIGAETNQPPLAEFVHEAAAQLPVVVQLDASSSTDDIDPPDALLYRWDFDDNGVFDTPFTNSAIANHMFPLPGSRFVTVQVKDRYGAVSAKRQGIHVPAPVGEPALTAPEPVFEVPMAADSLVFDPVRPCFYSLNQTTRRLMKVNLLNGLVEDEMLFDQKPLALAINPAGTYLYVALQPNDYLTFTPSSLIAEIDLASGFGYRTFEVPINAYKLAATDRRIVIVTGYTRNIYNLLSYSSSSGLELGKGRVYHNSEIALSPNQDKVFIAERNLSPSHVMQIVFDPMSGSLGEGTAIGSSSGLFFVDSTGQWVVTSYGKVYSTNAVYLRRLENAAFSGAWFDPARPAFFTVGDGRLSFYHPRTFELATTYAALPSSTYVGGWGDALYAVANETNRLVVQRMRSPGLGAETNAPPLPVFSATPTPFPSFQDISLDASVSRDDSTPADQLLFRWDWESDENFDTPFTNVATASHRFNIAGQTRVTLQVKDSFGEVGTLVRDYQVIPTPDPGVAVSNLLTQTSGLDVAGAVFDPVRPYLYLMDSASNRVLRVHLSTNANATSLPTALPAYVDRIFTLDLTPRLITITPSGARMAVAEFSSSEGPAYINVFDLQTLARLSQFQVPEVPYDILATDSLLIYSVRDRYGLRTYRLADGEQLYDLRSYGSGYNHLTLHPSQRFLYGTYTYTTSGNVRRFDIEPTTGVLTQTLSASSLDRAYSPGIFMNPLGTNLLTKRGYVCSVSENPDEDLATRTTLDPSQFDEAIFVPQRHALFTADFTSLNLFDLRDLHLEHTFDLGLRIRQLAVYDDRLYSLCETGTNLVVLSRMLPSTSVESNLPPSYVHITQPTNGAVIPLPGILRLETEAEDPDGWIPRVDYKLGFSYLGTSTNAGFQFAWTNPPPGTYPVTAIAQDNWGASVSSDSVNVTLNWRPGVEITSPTSNQVFVVPQLLPITVSASDQDGSVGGVHYYLNSTFVGSNTTAPFSFELDHPPVGTNILEAIAFDNLGTESLRATHPFVVLPAMPNDLFAGSVALAGNSFSISATNTRATLENGEPMHVADRGGHSIWYTWTADNKGIAILDTIGSDFDTLMAVYTGNTLSTLYQLASNNDFPGLGSLSRLAFTCLPGTVYHIAVDGVNGATGNVVLNMTFNPIPLGIQSPVIQAGSFAFRVDGPSGDTGVVETSTDLSIWVPVATNKIPFDFVYPAPSLDSARYFRARY